jgi:hypothetical protein
MQTKVIIQDDAFNRAVATAAKSLGQDFPSVMRDELGQAHAKHYRRTHAAQDQEPRAQGHPWSDTQYNQPL